jgi:hypothetical protein
LLDERSRFYFRQYFKTKDAPDRITPVDTTPFPVGKTIVSPLWIGIPAPGEAVLKSYEAVRPIGPPRRPDSPVTHQQIRRQLEKISATEEFQRSKRSSRFLNYIVEETLAGRASRIKAYSVAISVLDRDDTFDPQTDPMVRIEASQLRRRLERYYLTQGAADPVVIDLPKGGYVPVFRLAEVAAPPEVESKHDSRSFMGPVMSAALATALTTACIIVIAATLIFVPQRHSTVFSLQSSPALRILPFSAATPDERSAVVAAGLADEVTQVLTRHGTVDVLGPASGATGVSHAGAAMRTWSVSPADSGHGVLNWAMPERSGR